MAIDDVEVEVPTAEQTPDGEVTAPAANRWQCPLCGKEFPNQPSKIRRHLKAVHDYEAPEEPPKPAAPRGARRGRRAGGGSRTQQGLTLAYGLAAMAFGAFGPPPVEARQRTALAAQLTARQMGASLDRGLRKTPLYPLVSAVFGLGAFLDDLAPAALPLVVGMYNYAPVTAQARVRPMARMLAGQALHQAFGDQPPGEPEDVTPVALPAWIVQLTDQLFPEPSPPDGVVRPSAGEPS